MIQVTLIACEIVILTQTDDSLKYYKQRWACEDKWLRDGMT